LSGLEDELKQNAAAQELWSKKLVFSMIQAKLAVGGIDSGEFAFLIELGVQMGLVDQKTATMAQNLNANIDSLDWSNLEAGKIKWQEFLDMPSEKTVTVIFLSDDSGYMDPTCFVAGTPVTTPNGFIPIEDIQIGDVVSMKTAEGVISVSVENKKESTRSDLVTVVTSDGQKITCSPNHRWQLVSMEWREADKLTVGDPLNTDHGEVWVLGVERCFGKFLVYNMTTAHEEHTYMVGGLVVHNYKIGDYSVGGGGGMKPFVNMLGSNQLSASTVLRNGGNGGGTVINVYNPTFNVEGGKGIVDVLEALS
jgi:hypothetical protein